jgi:hypothetical protein
VQIAVLEGYQGSVSRDGAGYGQISPAVISASVPEAPAAGGFSPFQFFLLAVASGVTVWFLTRRLDRKG